MANGLQQMDPALLGKSMAVLGKLMEVCLEVYNTKLPAEQRAQINAESFIAGYLAGLSVGAGFAAGDGASDTVILDKMDEIADYTRRKIIES